MTYPQIVDYNEALQDPDSAFYDLELRKGSVAETPLGLPLAMSGGFALTYAVRSSSRKFAVRCFHREIPEVQSRYASISAKLREISGPHFVEFDFQSQGIRINGKPYPIVKMDWAEGETLGEYLHRMASNEPGIEKLRQAFSELCSLLEKNGVAHGDIQNENVIVDGQSLRLIDYDGMFVPGMQTGRGTEIGHKHFQHPKRETKHFGPSVDRFSFIVMDVSLRAIQADSSLYRRFSEGGQAVLFKAADFADPASSQIFQILSDRPQLRDSARKLAAICLAPASSVPTLSDFIAGRNIPTASVASITPAIPAAPAGYIGAFDVLDAKSFEAVLARVGDKVELVGEIVSVKEGVGKRGRGRGKSYIFINFGLWNKESVKVTIWSDVLGSISSRPNALWIGRWISVTGLIDPPYAGTHYGQPYRNVGINVTSESQIVQIDVVEAGYRLGGRSAVRKSAPNSMRTSNADLLREIKRHSSDTSRLQTRANSASRRTGTPYVTKNQALLRGLHAAKGSGGSVNTHSSVINPSGAGNQSPNTPKPRPGSRIPGWLWAVGALIIFLIIMRAGK